MTPRQQTRLAAALQIVADQLDQVRGCLTVVADQLHRTSAVFRPRTGPGRGRSEVAEDFGGDPPALTLVRKTAGSLQTVEDKLLRYLHGDGTADDLLFGSLLLHGVIGELKEAAGPAPAGSIAGDDTDLGRQAAAFEPDLGEGDNEDDDDDGPDLEPLRYWVVDPIRTDAQPPPAADPHGLRPVAETLAERRRNTAYEVLYGATWAAATPWGDITTQEDGTWTIRGEGYTETPGSIVM